MALARKVVAFYRENGQAPERLGATIDRAGFDAFRQPCSETGDGGGGGGGG